MKAMYEDVLAAIANGHEGDPIWYDENGTPRFATHHPEMCPDIYASEVALLEIACQACERVFRAQMSRSSYSTQLRAEVKSGAIHYGDPPNADCCPAGPTMNCLDLRVVEFWARGSARKAIEASLHHAVPDPPVVSKVAVEVTDTPDVMAMMEWRRFATFEIELPDASAPRAIDY
jgi:hypothetical protein